MNTRCCQSCRLRFTPDAAQFLTDCPECGTPLTLAGMPRRLVGFRLFDPLDIADVIPDPIPPTGAVPAWRRH